MLSQNAKYGTVLALLLLTGCSQPPQRAAVATARAFMTKQPDAAEVNLDSTYVRSDSVEWQVYFYRRQPRRQPFELVAINKQTKVPRRVALR